MGIDPKDSRFGPLLPLDGRSLKPFSFELLRLKSKNRREGRARKTTKKTYDNHNKMKDKAVQSNQRSEDY
jgi:hypothetical protein